MLAVTAYGALGDLVASWPNIGTSTHYGLAADANYLYSFYYYSTWNYPIIRTRRTTGAFVSSYPAPGSSSWYPRYTRGLSYDGVGYLYAMNYSRDYVSRFRASNGASISTWGYPTAETRYGICVDHNGTTAGTYIYSTYYTNLWWKNTLTGSLVRNWRRPVNTRSYDLAWDYRNKLIWYGNYDNEYIYGCNTNGSIVDSFALPGPADNPYGIAYWANRLYVSTTSGAPNEHIWVFDCPATVGVEPASVGRVKALFQ
jgi:hypothetical protein